MKKDIFDKTNPFTVPDGYFDTLQERIMSRVEAEEKVKGRTIHTRLYRVLVAAAACILFVFTGTTLYKAHTNKHPAVAESVADEDFYQWVYASDRTTQLAESLEISDPVNVATVENGQAEEDEAIIHFLEQNNVNVAAIVHSMNEE